MNMRVLAEELQTGDVIRLAPDALTFTIEAAELGLRNGRDCVRVRAERQDGWRQDLVLEPGRRVEVLGGFACNPDEAAYADLEEKEDERATS